MQTSGIDIIRYATDFIFAQPIYRKWNAYHRFIEFEAPDGIILS